MIDPNQSKKGKLPLAEVHPKFLESLCRVSEISKRKGYAPLNWVQPSFKGGFVNYLGSAALRHINKFLCGEDFNIEKDESGKEIRDVEVLHVEAAAYNLLMIATLFRQGRTDLDDRKIESEEITLEKELQNNICQNYSRDIEDVVSELNELPVVINYGCFKTNY